MFFLIVGVACTEYLVVTDNINPSETGFPLITPLLVLSPTTKTYQLTFVEELQIDYYLLILDFRLPAFSRLARE
jgi:hypothetical protein